MLAYKELNDYIHERIRSSMDEEYCNDSERIGRILIKLPLLAELDISIIEEIFFVGLIGKIDLFVHILVNEFGFAFL